MSGSLGSSGLPSVGGPVTFGGGTSGTSGAGGAVTLVSGAAITGPAFMITPGFGGSAASDGLPSFAKPDPSLPDTLGWRAWIWSEEAKCLLSPHQHSPWPEAELVIPHWDEGDVVRGVAGIHARLVPKRWRYIGWPDGDGSGGIGEDVLVTGIVERFGRYVLGTMGWRAEWVVIKELVAPTTDIGLALEKLYPDVVVHYLDQLDGGVKCESVKSSELGKGNRSTSRPRPAPSLAQSQVANQSVLTSQSLLAHQHALQLASLNQRRAQLAMHLQLAQAQQISSIQAHSSLITATPQNISQSQKSAHRFLPYGTTIAQTTPPDLSQSQPALTEDEQPTVSSFDFKMSAVVFWAGVVLGIILIAKLA